MSELTALPDAFSAGSTVVYRRTITDYPASGGWTLTLYLAGASVLSSAAAASGSDHVVTLAASATDDLTPGVYRWVERVAKGGEVFDVGEGGVEVTANLATASAGSLQSWAEQALAAVEAKIDGRITADQEEFEILGRAVKRIPFDELYVLRGNLRAEVAAERRAGAPRPPVLAEFTRMGFDA